MSTDQTRTAREYEILYRPQYEERGGKGDYDRGVMTSRLSEWREFYEEVRRFRDKRDYVWRGQQQHGGDWTLRSTFDRKKRMGSRAKILARHREEFSKAIRGRPRPNPPGMPGDYLWALGQHHGLATPLLDWTESPFVAAYWAFCPEKEDGKDRVVYALNRDIERWHPGDPDKRFIDFPPMTDYEEPRFLAQRGVFTKALEGQDIKSRIQKCYHEENHKNRIILAEILIPDSERDECLMDLDSMNINHATLFPDIEGSAAFCNWKLDTGLVHTDPQ
ncbi:MAG: FRG domain-containing protein [Planctomycetota bacterium]|jgi:hypothetical protein